MASLTLAIYPVHDEDSKSSKDEGKLREHHLWEGAELSLAGDEISITTEESV